MQELRRRSGGYDTTEKSLTRQWFHVDPGDTLYDQGEVEWTCAGRYNSFIGWDNPDFHRRRAKGELLPHTPWEKFSNEWSSTGIFDVRWFDGVNTCRAWHTGNVPIRTSVDPSSELVKAFASDITTDMVQEAAAAIYSSGYDALTALAELTEVRKMFANAAKMLLSLRIPRGFSRISSFEKTMKGRSNEWLEFRYGWRTFVFDLLAINDTIKTWNDKARDRYSESKYSVNLHNYSTVIQVSDYFYQADDLVTDVGRVRHIGSVTADIMVPKLQFNPFNTAWELVPLSFVVDWFVSIGKMLSAMSFLTFQTQYSASAGVAVEIQRDVTRSITGGQNGWTSGGHTGTSTSKSEYVVRNPCRVPITPHFKLNLDGLKITDLLALVVQRIRR